MKITPQQWEKAKTLFEAALGMEPERRASFLAGACADDDVRKRVQQLLEYHLESADFLNDPALNSPILNLGDILSQINRSNDDSFDNSSQPQASAALPADASTGADAAEAVETFDPMVGRRLGAYKLIEHLGHGGMAAVYLAVRADDQYQKQVAVKVIRPGLDSEEILARFRTERQTLAALDHGNIVRLLDGGSTEEGLPYLVMEYVEGLPIDQYCDEQKLSIEQRLRLFCEVCAAVEHAHRKLVIHRDLKPCNILVTADGTPKLLDFGIAKVLEPTQSTQILVTQTNMHRMTPAYASPEQVRGEGVTPESDVYCLAVVLYELLTGHRPYKLKQATPAEIERAICEQEPENPSTAVDRMVVEKTADGTTVTRTPEFVSKTREGQPDRLRRRLRGDLDTIVLTALSKEVAWRYSSAQEFSADIRRHLAHLPIKARRTTVAYRASRFLLRHKTELSAAAVIVMVLLAAFGYSVWERSRSMERARTELMNERSRGRRSVAVLGFRNLSARTDTAWLSTALSEMLTTELSMGGKLRAIPGENIAETKINLSLAETDSLSKHTLQSLYKNLGSDFVVLGSYLDTGDPSHRVRLDLQVQDAALGETVATLAETGSETSLPDLATRAGADLRRMMGISSNVVAESKEIDPPLPSDPEAARLYAEGLTRLRAFDALTARELLEKAVAIDPSCALAHSRLADAWMILGYTLKAREEAKKALDAAGKLSREETLFIEARYRETVGERDKAIELYRTLLNFFPDSLDYGLRLASAQSAAGKPHDGLATLAALRGLPSPSGADPRIDLGEADTAKYSGDYAGQLAAAIRAEQKGRMEGARLLVAQALVSQGEAYRSLGDPRKSAATSSAARDLFSSVGDLFGESRVLRNMGAVYFDQGDFESAKQSFQQAMQIRHDLGNKAGEAAMLSAVAGALQLEKDFKGAKEIYGRSLVISRELGDKSNVATTLLNLGGLEKDIGELAAADQHLQESVSLIRDFGNSEMLAEVLINLGLLDLEMGNPVHAARTLEQSVTIARQGSDRNLYGDALEGLASVRLATGDLPAASKLFNEAMQVLAKTGNQGATADALESIGDILFAQDDLSGAQKKYQECLAIRERLGQQPLAIATRISLAELALEQNHPADSEVAVGQAIEQLRSQSDVNAQTEAEALLARVLVTEGKLQEAENAISRARTLVAKSANPRPNIVVSIADAQIRSAAGYPRQAIKLLHEALKRAAMGGLLPLQMEVRLAQGEAEAKAGNSDAAQVEFLSLGRDARAKGFLLIARKATAARVLKSHGERASN